LVILLVLPLFASADETADVYPYDVSMPAYWFKPAVAEYVPQSDAKALLLMEYSSGKVLFALNENEKLPIASVTKVMSALLVTEAIDDGRITLEDTVTVSENAASLGGSQIYLEPGEKMSVLDLLKSLVVSSANDATLALGEYVCGSEASFVSEMNKRASELGCKNTNFVNTNGLPAEGHYSSALDVALITRELMSHPMIFDFTGIWMDTIRNGSFGLSNTNKLIRFYNGATGMKTGFTAEAGFCLSGTAKRDGMQLIAVVLGCSTSDNRFSAAKNLLDYGFANYCVVTPEPPATEPVKILRGKNAVAELCADRTEILAEKSARNRIESFVELPESVKAPLSAGDEVGEVVYKIDGQEIARASVRVRDDQEEMTFFTLLGRIIETMFTG
ncbi:MAG: D-alanyl-D-alanine carboxypeptidase, partial [Clostridia bacterium]|nr:D-alanyl-D-alanine carboxypeptidase [Clostridia bacterium]